MDFDKWLIFWRSVTWIVPVLAAIIIGISQWRIGRLEKQQKAQNAVLEIESRKAFEKNVVENVRENMVDFADKGYADGISVTAVLTIHEHNVDRDKYLFDMGYIDHDRWSLFLNKENELIYRLIDHQGYPYIIKIAPRFHTFKPEERKYFHAEFAISETYSFIRLYINDKEVGRLAFNSPLKWEPGPDACPLLIATDITKTYFGKFEISSLAISEETFSRSQRNVLFATYAKFLADLNRN